MDPDPDPLVRSTDPRMRIPTRKSKIPNTAFSSLDHIKVKVAAEFVRSHVCFSTRISRRCVGAWLHPLSEEDGDLEPWDGRLLLNICPEVSLVEQGYACAECRVQFQPDGAHRCVVGQNGCPNRGLPPQVKGSLQRDGCHAMLVNEVRIHLVTQTL